MLDKADRCPYCAERLDPPPKATKKCPHCGGKMHLVRIYARNRRELLTDEQAEQNRKSWGEYSEAMRCLALCGLSDADYRRAERILQKQWGVRPGPGDVVWKLMAVRTAEAMAAGDLDAIGQAYNMQAHWLHLEGRPAIGPARLASKADLQAINEGIVRGMSPLQMRVVVTASSDACDACRAAAGRSYLLPQELDRALEELPIPSPDCERGRCMCFWAPLTVHAPPEPTPEPLERTAPPTSWWSRIFRRSR
jgi:hypothetical protein